MPGMNKLPADKRIHIISLLCEGMSLRAVTRITGASINTVTKLLEDAGEETDFFEPSAGARDSARHGHDLGEAHAEIVLNSRRCLL